MEVNYIQINQLEEIDGYLKDVKSPIILIINEGKQQRYGNVYKNIFGQWYGDQTKNLKSIIHNFINYESKQGRCPFGLLSRGTFLDRKNLCRNYKK